MRKTRNTFLAITRSATPAGEKLLALHKEGRTTEELAREFGCVPSTIIRALRSLGVKLSRGRPQGAKDRRPRQVRRKGNGKAAAAGSAEGASASAAAMDERWPEPAAAASASSAEALPTVHATFCAEAAA